MKKIITSLFTLALAAAPLCAQAQNRPADKLDATARMAIRQQTAAQTNGLRGNAATPTTGFICTVTDAKAVRDAVVAKGGKAMIISDQCVTIHLPANQILDIAGLDGVKKIYGSQEMRQFNDVSKVSTGVDKVQAGTDLDTPFKGAGVLVGVADNGFQYNLWPLPTLRVSRASSRCGGTTSRTKSLQPTSPSKTMKSAAVTAPTWPVSRQVVR